MKRKQLLFLLALLMTAATGAWAQQTLTVYEGTGRQTTSPASIVYCDEFARSQTIIPSTALTAMKGCDITAMTFYSGNVTSFTTECSFDVYLKEVSYSVFTDPYTFEPQSSCTTVYQGTLSVVNGTITLTVTFSKPFHYNGGNLLIGAENTSKISNYPYIEFQGTNTNQDYTNISIHHSTNLASATQIAKSSFIPKTTFTYVVPTYTVKLADGTQDAANWTIASGENSATGDAADGLTGLYEGDAVTLTYGGRLKVKSVTATKAAATSVPEGAINGIFTIAEGSKVYFSKGNLQATYSDNTWTWAFAENQWDYIGNNTANTSINGNGTVSTPGTVDLFGWVGATNLNWSEPAAIYGITNSTTVSGTYGYGNSSNDVLKADWGNTIDGNWRTLTLTEWVYLFNTRTSGSTVNGTSNARYTFATINTVGGSGGVNGIILFPDGVTIASDEATPWGNINAVSDWGTKCTSEQWTALAAKGCVFLPAAGRRYFAGSEWVFIDFGSSGYYWSATPDESNNAMSRSLFFETNSVNPGSSNFRSYGCSVRLVIAAE